VRRVGTEHLNVFVAGCDEYTTLLVARHLPGARILTRPSRRRPRLAVVEAADEAAVADVVRARPAGVVAISDRPDPPLPFAARVVIRPFQPGALPDAIDDELQRPARERVRPTIPAAIRLALMTLGAGVHGFGEGTTTDMIFIFAVVLYGIARLLTTRFEREARAADVAVACVLVAAGGGATSGFVAFAAMTVALAGMTFGWRSGAVAGGLVSVAAGTPAVLEALAGRAGVTDTLALLALFPLGGVTGGMVRRLQGAGPDRAILAETNRLLTRLHGIAREAPGGMDTQTVSAAIVAELREMGVPAAAVLADDDGQIRVRAGYGVAIGPLRGATSLRSSGSTRVLDIDRDAPALRGALTEYRRWIVAPAARNGRIHGILLAAVPNTGDEPARRSALDRLAGDAAVAFENAELLRRVGALAADEERRRIALRVHDGLAQTLTHLRLELDFIARHGNDGTRIRQELERMSRVVDRAVGDVHGLMNDLRTDGTRINRSEPAELPFAAGTRDSGKERMPA